MDSAPTSNADVGMTIAHLLGLTVPPKGTPTGRVLSEGLKGGRPVPLSRRTVVAPAAASGFTTTLVTQSAGGETYFDAAG